MRAIAISIVALLCMARAGYALPDGFTNELVVGGFEAAVGVTFATDGRALVWEKPGRVWTVVDGVRDATPLLDISEEVANYGDYGLVGFALDPEFLTNGHYYLLYAVDHYHLMNFGDAEYDSGLNEYFRATVGRLTRFTADVGTDFHTTVGGSRTVLIGATHTSGIPLMAQSHGPGSLVFGSDGTLLISCGDAASSQVVDTGGDSQGTYTTQGLAEGILTPDQNVGAYRAQLVDSLCGKVLRVDPATGDGVSSNPFFDGGDPAAARSRVWALGFRQPYRMTLKPGTGSSDPLDANPGTLYVGDVGWAVWEELSVVSGPAQNFGWPLFEGLEAHANYAAASPSHPTALNPLSCQTNFNFDDLLIQETTDPDPWFPNPCDGSQEIPASVPRFVHTRPILEWNHASAATRTGSFSGQTATIDLVGAPGSSVQGAPFSGSCSTGGAWYSGTLYPLEYRNKYFHGDFVGSWIRMITVDTFDRPTEVVPFADAQSVVDITENLADGMLYFISYTGELRRLAYSPCGNQAPVAVIDVDQNYGPGPLTVQFDASAAFDPDGSTLEYAWDFGDGSTSTEVTPTHVFSAAAGVPTRFDVTLTVTDPFGATHSAGQIVSVNNTPPVISIDSPLDGELYSVSNDMVFPCEATVSDAEHGPTELTCAWQTVLHHETHAHPEPLDLSCSTTTVTSPVGCGSEVYFYRVRLTVTDAAGLSTSETVTLLPDCSGSPLGVLHVGVHPHEATVASGEDLELMVEVDNGGAVDLSNVQVVATCDLLTLQSGDVDGDGVLATDETWTYVCAVDNVTASFTSNVVVTADSPSGTVSAEHEVHVLVVPANARVTDGQIAVYAFDEGAGSTVYDVSGVASPMDLTIQNPGAVTWLPGGGLSVDSPTGLLSSGPASELMGRLQTTQEFTLEAWLRPGSPSQTGPARIVALTVDPVSTGGNMMLGQSNDDVDFRLRTTQTNQFGLPDLAIPGGSLSSDLVHLTVTRSICSGMRFYQDGVLVLEAPLQGDLAGWEASAWLALANEPTLDRPWLGELHLVAFFDRALTLSEIDQNFAAGPQGLLISPPTIDASPVSQAVCAGDDVTLEVVAAGPPPLFFQWRRDGFEIAGATAATYELAAIDPLDSGSYDVVVSNVAGSVISPPAVIGVSGPPTLIQAPLPQTVCLGDPAMFDVVAAGAVVSYEWYRDGIAIGETSPQLSIDAVTAVDWGLYTVVVSGPCGSVTSVGVELASLPVSACEIPRRRGDCNDDQSINLVDAIALLSHLFVGLAVPCRDACDANDDGVLDVADALYELQALFGGGPAIPAPSDTCGFDPTADPLDCGAFVSCP